MNQYLKASLRQREFENFGGGKNANFHFRLFAPIDLRYFAIISRSALILLYYFAMSQSTRSITLFLIAGNIAWVVAGVIALAAGSESKVIWTCIAGFVLGVIGTRYTLRRARRIGL